MAGWLVVDRDARFHGTDRLSSMKLIFLDVFPASVRQGTVQWRDCEAVTCVNFDCPCEECDRAEQINRG